MDAYTAEFQREAQAWIVHLRELPEVHSWAVDLDAARANIREALVVWLDLDDVDDVPLREVVLPAESATATA